MEKLHSRYDSCTDKIGRNHLEKHSSRILRHKKRAWWGISWNSGWTSPTAERKVKELAIIWKIRKEKKPTPFHFFNDESREDNISESLYKQ